MHVKVPFFKELENIYLKIGMLTKVPCKFILTEDLVRSSSRRLKRRRHY